MNSTMTGQQLSGDRCALPRGERRRHGFIDLKARDRWLYGQLRGHIRTVVDLYDWGFRITNTKKKARANKKDECLNFWLDRRISRGQKADERHVRKQLKRLSFARIEEHCKDEQTIYVSSHPFSRYAVIMLDFDDHDEQNPAGDCVQAFEYIKSFFPAAYHQTSTFGLGYHAYVFVHYPEMSVKEFRSLLNKLEKALKAHLKAAKFRCDFEIKGVPGVVSEHGTYETCGLLAKFPRLASDDEVRDYLQRPIYSPVHLRDVLSHIDTASSPPPSPVLRCGNSVSESKYGEEEAGGSRAHARNGGRERTDTSNDPARRMGMSGFETALKLGRPPSADEILSEYVGKNRHTGHDHDGNRAKLAQGSADWLAINFRRGMYIPEKYMSLITTYVTPVIRDSARKKNRSRYSDEELAITLYTIEKTSLVRNPQSRWQFTVPNNSIMGMMAKLGLIRLLDKKADPKGRSKQEDVLRHRIALMKHVLVEAKLAVVINEQFTFGLGKKYGIGPAHPEYERFLSFAEQFGVRWPVEAPQPDGDPRTVWLN